MKVPYFYDLSIARSLEAMSLAHFPKNSLSPKLQTILTDNMKLDYPLHPLQYHLPKHPLNVLLIVIDTLRYDMINPTNMPNVYQFAQHADQFLNNMSGGDCTKPGIFSLFYGIPATYWNAAIEHHQGSILIRAFQANHYQLGLYASAPLTSPQFDQTVFTTVKNLQITTPGATSLDRDAKITDEMQHFLNSAAKNHKPFFGFMFYDAPHAYNAVNLSHPFHPIGSLNYFSINNKTPITPIYNLYKNAVFADDQLVKKIFQTLKADHLSQNTVVIVTADHGQEFNDDHNNYWEHASGFSKYQMRTPMIIAWPHRAPNTFHNQTMHFDLAPTLLKRVLGVSNPSSDYSIGDDFFSKKQMPIVIAGNYSYFALITKNNIMQFQKSGLYQFTDLQMKPLKNKIDNQVALADALHDMKMYQ
jgi:membrane-anchored protein YejM (alkaline phosphatase superfamily)